nr:putative ribonuclease H-like domain-containing protein [Tanacetum cinerariifolium]
KKIFKYLKGQPKSGLWYLRESSFVLEAYSDSDYAGANKDRKSTTGGCPFLGRRLITWQCKKQTIVATSFTEAEYVVAANCSGQSNGSRGWISDFQVLYMDQVDHFVLVMLIFLLVDFSVMVRTAQNLNPSSTSSIATLRYKDEHKKVGYLLKPTRSDDYHQIIGFLRASHIRSPELGPPAIQATIDKTPYTITEYLVRSQLQLADDGGIDDLPTAEIYFGMDNLGPLTVALICLSDGRQFNWSIYIFKGMGHPMPLLAVMLSQDQEGEGAGVASQVVPQHMHAPDQPQDHLSTPPRQQTSDPTALVFEHGQSSALNIASFSRTHETADGPSTNVEDAPLGGSVHMSPPRSTQAPPVGQTSGGAEDLLTLTLVQKVHSLETKLKDHKKLFKDVVGKLVKKVKAMKVKLRTSKRKMVVSDSDQEERGKQDVDLDALLALANAAVIVDSNISLGGASDNPAASTSVSADVPTGASNVPTDSTSVPANVPTSVAPAGVSNKRKTPMVEEDIPVKERTFKQMQEDILGEQAAKRLHDEEQAQVDRQRAELQRRRQ